MREAHRYFRNTNGNYWVLTRYDDIREAFQNPAVFCNRSIVPTDPDPVYRFLPSYSDPPQHMKYRQTMNRWFAPAAVTKFSPELQRLARETVGEVSADGATDYLKTFGDHFPVRGFLLSMGLPQDNAYTGVLREAMAVDSLDPVGVYFGTSTGQLYGSRDEGQTWRLIADNLPSIWSVDAAVVG